MVNTNMLCHHHKKISSLPFSVGAIIFLDPINPYVAQNAKALERVLYKAHFLSTGPFPVKTFNNCTRQNFANLLLRPSHKNM